jgi:PAS domain S-box-containing protein
MVTRRAGRGLVCVMLDITERKRMEARLQQAATVFDSSAEGITITAPDGSIIAVNRAFTEITGYSEEEVIGRNPRMLQSGRQDRISTGMWQDSDDRGRWQGELWNRRKDGQSLSRVADDQCRQGRGGPASPTMSGYSPTSPSCADAHDSSTTRHTTTR